MKKALTAVITIGFITLSGMAFAGMGNGYMGMHGKGSGGHHEKWNDGQCQRWNTENLSKEDQAALETEYTRYRNETKELRRSIYQKKLALRSELAKTETDIKVAKKLQKEISEMKSTCDEKRLEHIMAMKKINPDAGMGSIGKGHGGKRKYGCPRQ